MMAIICQEWRDNGVCDINQSDFTVKFSRLNFEAHVETVNYLCYKIIFISKTDGKWNKNTQKYAFYCRNEDMGNQ